MLVNGESLTIEINGYLNKFITWLQTVGSSIFNKSQPYMINSLIRSVLLSFTYVLIIGKKN